MPIYHLVTIIAGYILFVFGFLGLLVEILASLGESRDPTRNNWFRVAILFGIMIVGRTMIP